MLGTLISIIPLIGYFGVGPGFFAVLFGILSYLMMDEKKWIPILGVILGLTSFSFGLKQFFEFKEIITFESEVKKIAKDKIKEDVVTIVKEGRTKEVLGNVSDFLKEPPNDPSKTLQSENTPTEHCFIATVDKLRIRETASLDAEVLAVLDFGDKVIDLKESSEQKEKIVLGGIERNEPWRKIKYESSNFSEPVVAWAYGGGVSSVDGRYVPSSEYQFTKVYDKVHGYDLEPLLGFGMGGGWFYHGVITFRKKADQGYVPDGSFFVKAVSPKGVSDAYDHQATRTYRGTIVEGKLHGILYMTSHFYETGSESQIMYDHGTCIWYESETNSEGEISRDRVDNIEDCSRYFVSSTAVQ